MSELHKEQPCPCGIGETLASCCDTIHRNDAGLGSTAEQLMRARYSAYALGLDHFVLSSWHPDTRPPALGTDPGTEWLGLDVIETERGGGLDNDGIVEFVATFRRAADAEPIALHERSSFVRVGANWRYVDGET